MINKTQIRKIVFIKNSISNHKVFQEDLLNKLECLYLLTINQTEFDRWLDSWIATAELDLDKTAASRIKKALQEIKDKKTPYKTWGAFKDSIGL